MKSRFLPPLFLLGVLCSPGCSGPSVVGTWTVTPAEQLPVPATIKTTFAAPDKATTVVLATSSVPAIGELKLEADVTGKWTLEGDKLTMTAQDATLKSSDGKDLPSFVADQAKAMIKDNLTKGSTGKMKWDGNDKFVVTTESGKTATFVRDTGK